MVRYLLKIEDGIIDFLTMITWWTEVRFNKSKIFLAVLCQILESLILGIGCITIFSEMVESSSYQLYYISFVFFFIALIPFRVCFEKCRYIRVNIEAIQNWLYQENNIRHRMIPDFYKNRRAPLWVAVGMVVAALFFSLGSYQVLVLFLIAMFLESLEFFLLSCDPIPEEEKERRKENNITYKINSKNKN